MKFKMDLGIQHLMKPDIRGHLLVGYAVRIILYKNQMIREFGMRILNKVANRKVDNILKPIESKRSSNANMNNC